MADAYELNGDWRQALNARAALHGDKSDEFTWAKARILYATGDRENALKLICNATLSVSYISVDSVLQKRETERERRRKLGWDELQIKRSWLMAETSPAWPEWFALWKLRDHCARVIYPELHYVAVLDYQSKMLEKGLKEGEALFNAKQREGFERCLTFMEEELARLPEEKRARFAPQVEFLKSLQRLPYELGRLKGM